MNWLKLRFPVTVFTLLMALETVNFASDCFQLATVVETQEAYTAHPFFSGGYREHTVVWRIVRDPLHGNLLGFRLPWYGDAYGDTSEWGYANVYLYCLGFDNINNKNKGDSSVVVPKQIISKSQSASSDICIQYSQVFTRPLTDGYGDPPDGFIIACPNNITGVFDAKSYVRISNNKYSDNSYGEINLNVKWWTDTPFFGNSIYSLYAPNWEQYIRPVSACQALSGLYFGTIVIFSFEVFLVFSQFITGMYMIWTTKDEETRIKYMVELPLVGFLFPMYLKEEKMMIYKRVNDAQGVDGTFMGHLLGLNLSENPLNTKVIVSWFFFPCCIQRPCSCPHSVTLLQALLYPLYLPFSSELYVAVGENCCTFYILSFIAFFITSSIFIAEFLFFFAISVAYGDRMYVSRILHDIPSIGMTSEFLAKVEFSSATAMSTAFSTILVSYYLYSVIINELNRYKCCQEKAAATEVEEGQKEDTQVEVEEKKPFSYQLYGSLTLEQSCYMLLLQPFVVLFAAYFYLPFVALGFSCVVDRGSTTTDGSDGTSEDISNMIELNKRHSNFEMAEVYSAHDGISDIPSTVNPQSNVEMQGKKPNPTTTPNPNPNPHTDPEPEPKLDTREKVETKIASIQKELDEALATKKYKLCGDLNDKIEKYSTMLVNMPTASMIAANIDALEVELKALIAAKEYASCEEVDAKLTILRLQYDAEISK